MNARRLFALVVALGATNLSLPQAIPETDDELAVNLEDIDALTPNASIFEVIANSERFAGKEVCLAGVLSLAGRDRLSIVYTSKESREHRISINGVALHFDSTVDRSGLEDADGMYVAVLGILETDSATIRQFLHPLHAILVHGRLLRVTKIMLIEDSTDAGDVGG